MREKERVIQGGGDAKRRRRRVHIYVGPNWIMIFLIGEKLLWQAPHKETACLSKAKSNGWDIANISLNNNDKKSVSSSEETDIGER